MALGSQVSFVAGEMELWVSLVLSRPELVCFCLVNMIGLQFICLYLILILNLLIFFFLSYNLWFLFGEIKGF